jgi:hypothetical protein
VVNPPGATKTRCGWTATPASRVGWERNSAAARTLQQEDDDLLAMRVLNTRSSADLHGLKAGLGSAWPRGVNSVSLKNTLSGLRWVGHHEAGATPALDAFFGGEADAATDELL